MLRCSLGLILLAAGTLWPQSLDNPDYRLNVDVELVQLPVFVSDKDGFPFKELQKEHFTVYEDKVLQDISLFKQEDTPLSVSLVIDASGSMLEKLDRLDAAVTTFTRESNPGDETSIVTFGKDVFLQENFSGDSRDLYRALISTPANRGTALYDAVFQAAKHLEHNGSHEKKVLIVVSDGEDNKSTYNLDEVRKAIGESKVIVYTVGLLSPDSGMLDVGKRALKSLADGTGGASFTPRNLKDVEEVCKRIARDLRNQYTIGYRPSNLNLDGSWRKVSVRINPPKHTPSLKIRTKDGYYAPKRTAEPVQESIK